MRNLDTLSVLLAALRSYQKCVDDPELMSIATDEDKYSQPTADDIDLLCDLLNRIGTESESWQSTYLRFPVTIQIT